MMENIIRRIVKDEVEGHLSLPSTQMRKQVKRESQSFWRKFEKVFINIKIKLGRFI